MSRAATASITSRLVNRVSRTIQSRDQPAPPLPSRDWVVFDTNAVRALGELGARPWSEFLSSWREAGLRTAWVPPVVVEIAGTNLSRKNGLAAKGLQEVQAAARRFDLLAGREIEPDADALVRRSFYEVAGVPVPAPMITGHGAAWRAILDALQAAASPSEVVTTSESDGARSIGIRPPGTASGWNIVIPPGFEAFVRQRVAATTQRVQKSRGPASLERDVAEVLPLWGVTLGERFGVPEEVVQAALDPARKAKLFCSSFAVRAACEIAYDHERLPRGRSRVQDPNDQLDLALTTYLFGGRSVITNDGHLRRVLYSVLADRRRVVDTPSDLLRELSKTRRDLRDSTST